MVCLSSSNFLKAVFHKFYFTNSILEYFAPVLLCICCMCRSIDRKIDWLTGTGLSDAHMIQMLSDETP